MALAEDVIKVVEERGTQKCRLAPPCECFQVEGWHAVNWMEGFTMLHWAAEKGHSDFCRHSLVDSGCQRGALL